MRYGKCAVRMTFCSRTLHSPPHHRQRFGTLLFFKERSTPSVKNTTSSPSTQKTFFPSTSKICKHRSIRCTVSQNHLLKSIDTQSGRTMTNRTMWFEYKCNSSTTVFGGCTSRVEAHLLLTTQWSRATCRGLRVGSASTRSRVRRGVTLIEVLVAIGVIGLLAALLFPAIQSSRESARKVQCLNHLKQLTLACNNYTSTYGCYPGGQLSAFVSILPELDQKTLFAKLQNLDDSFNVPPEINNARPAVLACPSDNVATGYRVTTSYNWNRGWDGPPPQPFYAGDSTGVILPGRKGIIREADVTDGLSNTGLLAEALPVLNGIGGRQIWRDADEYAYHPVEILEGRCRNATRVEQYLVRSAPWTSGIYGHSTYDHAVAPNGKTCSFVQTAGSAHSMPGTHLALCDGSVRFVSAMVNLKTWQALGTRSGNDHIGE